MISCDAQLIGPWVADKTGGTWTPGRGTAIGKVDQDGTIQCGVLYEDFNGANIVCHIAGVGNWATREYLRVIFDYPFNQLKARRITVPVNANNEKSIRLVKRMGFTLECSLAQATPESDLYLFRMFAGECRFLKAPYALH